jgi:TPR repeat protein
MKKTILTLLFCASVFGNDYSDGYKAYHAGDFKTAMGLLKNVCDAGDNRGCVFVGIMYNKGLGVKQDPVKGSQYYRKMKR